MTQSLCNTYRDNSNALRRLRPLSRRWWSLYQNTLSAWILSRPKEIPNPPPLLPVLKIDIRGRRLFYLPSHNLSSRSLRRSTACQATTSIAHGHSYVGALFDIVHPPAALVVLFVLYLLTLSSALVAGAVSTSSCRYSCTINLACTLRSQVIIQSEYSPDT